MFSDGTWDCTNSDPLKCQQCTWEGSRPRPFRKQLCAFSSSVASPPAEKRERWGHGALSTRLVLCPFPPPVSLLRPPCRAQGWVLPARPVLCVAFPHICPWLQQTRGPLSPLSVHLQRSVPQPAVVWGRGQAARHGRHAWEHRGRSVSQKNGRINGETVRSRYRRRALCRPAVPAGRRVGPAVEACHVSFPRRHPHRLRAALGLQVTALLLRSRLPAQRFPNTARGRAAPRPPAAAAGRLLRAALRAVPRGSVPREPAQR